MRRIRSKPGRFVWHDLLTKDVNAAKRFYGELLGWRFEDTKRGERPYVLARSGGTLVAGIVDVSANADAGPQWLSYMAVADVDKTVAQVRTDGGKVLVEPRNLPSARAAVVADPQGAPLGLAQVRRSLPDPADPSPGRFFWDEYLARDAEKALDFYKRLAGYESAISESRSRRRLSHPAKDPRHARASSSCRRRPAAWNRTGCPTCWSAIRRQLGARVGGLGGRILLPAAPERRNGSLVVVADPGGAPLALQKFPF